MTADDLSTWGGAVLGLIGAGAGVYAALSSKRRETRSAETKEERSNTLEDRDEAVRRWRELFEEQGERLTAIEQELARVREQEAACRAETAALRTKVEYLERQMEGVPDRRRTSRPPAGPDRRTTGSGEHPPLEG